MRSSSIWLCIALPALLSASFSQAQTPTEADAGGTGTAADRRHVPGFRLQHVVWPARSARNAASDRLEAECRPESGAQQSGSDSAFYTDQGVEATPSTPAALRDLIASETERWRKVIKNAGITAEAAQ